jgi:hypothetical protein
MRHVVMRLSEELAPGSRTAPAIEDLVVKKNVSEQLQICTGGRIGAGAVVGDVVGAVVIG